MLLLYCIDVLYVAPIVYSCFVCCSFCVLVLFMLLLLCIDVFVCCYNCIFMFLYVAHIVYSNALASVTSNICDSLSCDILLEKV